MAKKMGEQPIDLALGPFPTGCSDIFMQQIFKPICSNTWVHSCRRLIADAHAFITKKMHTYVQHTCCLFTPARCSLFCAAIVSDHLPVRARVRARTAF